MSRPLAQKMFDALMMDDLGMVSNACLLDFGLDSPSAKEQSELFGALQNAVRRGATVNDLDFALGSSFNLTALVQKYGSKVVFPQTAYDLMSEEVIDEGMDYYGPE